MSNAKPRPDGLYAQLMRAGGEELLDEFFLRCLAGVDYETIGGWLFDEHQISASAAAMSRCFRNHQMVWRAEKAAEDAARFEEVVPADFGSSLKRAISQRAFELSMMGSLDTLDIARLKLMEQRDRQLDIREKELAINERKVAILEAKLAELQQAVDESASAEDLAVKAREILKMPPKPAT